MKYCFYSFAAKFKSTLKQAKWKQSFLYLESQNNQK